MSEFSTDFGIDNQYFTTEFKIVSNTEQAGLVAFSHATGKITAIAVPDGYFGMRILPACDWWKYISGKEIHRVQEVFNAHLAEIEKGKK